MQIGREPQSNPSNGVSKIDAFLEAIEYRMTFGVDFFFFFFFFFFFLLAFLPSTAILGDNIQQTKNP